MANSDKWYFCDMDGNVQGPFPKSAMREWYEGGYLSHNLLISPNPDARFTPLGEYFTDTSQCFLDNSVSVSLERSALSLLCFPPCSLAVLDGVVVAVVVILIDDLRATG